MTPSDADIRLELEHEEKFLGDGVIAYRERVQRLRGKRQEAALPYGKKLLNKYLKPLADAIAEVVEEAKTRPGRLTTACELISKLEPEVTAYLTLKVVVDSVTTRWKRQQAATQIGNAIHWEVRFRHFREQSPGLFMGVERNLEDHPMGYQTRVRRTQMVRTMRKFGVPWQSWTLADRRKVGLFLLELVITKLGIVTVESTGRRSVDVVPTPELVDWIAQYTARDVLLRPRRMPMIIPPKPWTSLYDGGYYHEALRSCLVLEKRRGYTRELSRSDLRPVLSAINHLQSTPWSINRKVLEVAQEAWRSGMVVGDMVSRLDIPLLAKPDDPDSEAYRRWKHQAGEIFRQNVALASKRIQVVRILSAAREMSAYPRIYFPARLDFRGRVYFSPQLLQPQGCDLAKSLLTFAEAKPLGPSGRKWLAVHVANCFGVDKVGFDERVQWTERHTDRILRIADDPLSDRWWTEADKPWQFLAACLEWAGAVREGDSYCCSLPVTMDGSCNGIQHFAAMSRDEDAGRLVNLVPADRPADIYAAVAVRVNTVLMRHAQQPDEYPFAQRWLDYGVSRDICKRPVMILPYGGTHDAVRRYILESVMDAHFAGHPHPFGPDVSKAATYLAQVVWDEMRAVIAGPMQVMDWLRKVTSAITKESHNGADIPVVWQTPSGWTVLQAYRRRENKVLEVVLNKTRIRSRFSFEGDDRLLDRRKQRQAISPNFVHSLDAAALCLTINRCFREGISAFMAIHDSYGTHAADVEKMQTILRDEFAKMYERHDPLREFLDQARAVVRKPEKLPPLPEPGTLDINLVRQSPFFFA